MEIVFRKVKDLKPYEKNPRKNDEAVKFVKASIEQFGFKVPIVIDKDGIIVAGHTRLKAAKELGMSEVPCIVADDLTEEQVKAYRLADNKTAEIAEWDIELLNTELLDLEANFDMADFGFEIEPPAVTDDDFDADAVADTIVEPVTKLGDIWTLGRHRLMCGDSTDKATVDRLMDGQKADMVFTDPPYSVNYEKKQDEVLGASGYHHIENDDMETSEIAERIWRPAFKNLFDCANDDCSFYLTMPQGGDQMMMMMSEKWQVKHELIWLKPSPVFSMGRLDYDYKHEPIAYGWKKKHNFYGKGEFVKSVWEIARDGDGSHPTMKPVKLIANALMNSTIENNTVIDLFGGSGSTLIACEQLNRTCYMMELDPKYCDVIIKRWETLTGQKAVLNGEV